MLDFNYLNESCLTANKDSFEASELITAKTGGSVYFNEYDYDSLSVNDYNGILLGNYLSENGTRKVLTGPHSHALICGGTGTGKTEGYFMPAIEMYAKSRSPVSLFITDTKGSIYNKTKQLFLDNGYNIYVLNFKEPFSSMRYNPLSYIYDTYRLSLEYSALLNEPTEDHTDLRFNGKTYATYKEWRNAVKKEIYLLQARCQTQLDYISSLLVPIENVKDKFWDYGSRDIVFSTLWGMLEDSANPNRHMTRNKFNIANLINIIQNTSEGCTTILNWVKARPKPSRTYNLLSYYGIASVQTRDSYVNNTANKLFRFGNIPIATITSTSDIDLFQMSRLKDTGKTAIYCLTDENVSITNNICSMFIYQLMELMQSKRDKQNFGESKPFIFMLDEFANLPQFPDIDKWLSTSRSRNIWFHLGLQSLSQLNDKYSEDISKIIADNCDTQIFFGSNSYGTVCEFSAALGNTCRTVTSYNLDSSGLISANFMPQNLPLVRPCDLATLASEHAYAKCFRKPVMYTELNYFYKYHDVAYDQLKSDSTIFNIYDEKTNFYDISKVCRSATADNSTKSLSQSNSNSQRAKIIDSICSTQGQHPVLSRSIGYKKLIGFFITAQTNSKVEERTKWKALNRKAYDIYENRSAKIVFSAVENNSIPVMLAVIYTGAAKNTLFPVEQLHLTSQSLYCEILTYSDNDIAFSQIIEKIDAIATQIYPDTLYINIPKDGSESIQSKLDENGFKRFQYNQMSSPDRLVYLL